MPTPADLRTSIRSLSTLAAHDLRDVWQTLTADAVKEALLDVLPDLTSTYALASATAAADWYDELREETAVGRRFSAIVADDLDLGAEALARWGVEPLYRPEPDWDAARSLITGGLQRRIADAARRTITDSSIEDPGARGWQRKTSGGCSFCEMLAGRGAVYTEKTVDFSSHDHCQCMAVPVFDGQSRTVRPYTPSRRSINDRDRARVRAYLAEHHAG